MAIASQILRIRVLLIVVITVGLDPGNKGFGKFTVAFVLARLLGAELDEEDGEVDEGHTHRDNREVACGEDGLLCLG